MLLQYIASKLMLLFLFHPLSSSLKLWGSRDIGPWCMNSFFLGSDNKTSCSNFWLLNFVNLLLLGFEL
jgi:hypothetical protein